MATEADSDKSANPAPASGEVQQAAEPEMAWTISESTDADDLDMAWPSPGERLKKMRKDRLMSCEEVSKALHITVHYVKALEADEYHKLPGELFVKGYYRAYAKLLRADVDEILAAYKQYCSSLEESAKNVSKMIQPEQQSKPLWTRLGTWPIYLAFLVIALSALIAVWWFMP